MGWQKKTLIWTVLLLFNFYVVSTAPAQQEEPISPLKGYQVGVSKIVSHPGIDDVTKGFIDTVEAYAKKTATPIGFDLQNAQGDMSTSMLIAKKFVGSNVNLIFTISTPSTQHAVKATQTIPIIFGAVTDPISAGIVKDLNYPGGNVTGVSDVWPIKKQVELLLKLVPSVKKLGLVYNPGESNATFMLEKLQEACDQLDLKLITQTIANTGEVLIAAKTLAPQVDAFYSSIDNTVLPAIASLVKVANQYKKPIIAGESDSVQKGAIATLGTNYYEVGTASGNLAIKVFEGVNPGEIPVVSDSKTDLYLNLKAIKLLGIKVPKELREQAKKEFN